MFECLPVEKQKAIGALFDSDETFMSTATNGAMWVDEM